MTGVWAWDDCDLAVDFFSDFFRGGLGLDAVVGVEGTVPELFCC